MNKIRMWLADKLIGSKPYIKNVTSHLKGSNAFWGKVSIAALIVIAVCIMAMPTG
jgi:hypothetical protein